MDQDLSKNGNKGGLGQLVEERYFHYKCNNKSKPDFEEAGVELKVTPYKEDKKGRKTAKERLVITMIDYHEVPKEIFETSHVWQKSRLILLVYYLFRKDVSNPLDYMIHYHLLKKNCDKEAVAISFFQNKQGTHVSACDISGFGTINYPDDFRDETQELLNDLMNAMLLRK